MGSPTKRTAYDWFLEFLAFSGLVVTLLPIIIRAGIRVETLFYKHFKFEHEISEWVNADGVWFIAAMTAVFYAGMLILERYPRLFNYPVKITEANRAAMQRLAIRLIRHIRVLSVLIFAHHNVMIFMTLTGAAPRNGWVIALLIGAMAVVMIIYVRAMFRQEKK